MEVTSMSLNLEQKQEIINKYQLHEGDSGSPESVSYSTIAPIFTQM
jgi:ribosomal protein S15P/S13E